MHYRNGREAKNSDIVVQLNDSRYGPLRVTAVGLLFEAKPGSDHCNGNIASTISGMTTGACLCDCLHMDDLASILKEKGLDKRPEGK